MMMTRRMKRMRTASKSKRPPRVLQRVQLREARRKSLEKMIRITEAAFKKFLQFQKMAKK
jgi:transcriptional regulator of acetoin/glycerol metabolism